MSMVPQNTIVVRVKTYTKLSLSYVVSFGNNYLVKENAGLLKNIIYSYVLIIVTTFPCLYYNIILREPSKILYLCPRFIPIQSFEKYKT